MGHNERVLLYLTANSLPVHCPKIGRKAWLSLSSNPTKISISPIHIGPYPSLQISAKLWKGW